MGNIINLHNSDIVAWQVTKGEYNIFCAAYENNIATGDRLHLAVVHKGSIVFAFPKASTDYTAQICMEGTYHSRVQALNIKQLEEFCSQSEQTFHELVERFIREISAVVMLEGLPAANVKKCLTLGRIIPVQEKQIVSAGKFLWCKLNSGLCHLASSRLDKSAAVLPPFQPGDIFPLVNNMCLAMDEDCSLSCCTTRQFFRQPDAYKFISLYLANVSEACSAHLAMNEIKHYVSTRKSEENNTRIFSSSIDNISQMMDTRMVYHPGADIIKVVQDVCRRIGHRLEKPDFEPADNYDGFTKILDAEGLMHRKISLGAMWWKKDGGPAIAFNKKGRAFTLYFKHGTYYLYNPGDNSRQKACGTTVEDFQLDSAYVIYPKLSEPKITAKRMLAFSLRNSRKDIIRTAACGLFAGTLGFVIPTATAYIIDNVVDTGDRGALLQFALAVFAAAFGFFVFTLAKSVAFIRFEGKAVNNLQPALFQRMLKMPLAFFKQFTAGDLARRVLTVEGIQRMLSAHASAVLLTAVFTGMNLVLMLIYTWQLALIAIGVTIAVMLFLYVVCKRMMKMEARNEDTICKMAGLELEFATAISKIRVAGAENRAFSLWAGYFVVIRRISYKIGLANAAIATLGSLLPLLTSILVYWAIIRSGMYETYSLGAFLCFFSAMGQYVGALAMIASISLSLSFLKPMYSRARPLFDTPPEDTDKKPSPGELNGSISINNLTFAYPNSPILFNRLSLNINPGEFVAIVGDSGCGKSTLLRLLLGFEKPAFGTISYDRQDLSKIDLSALRKQIGTVQQNSQLMSGTILENVTGHNPRLTIEDVWQTLKAVNLAHEIKQMPMGVHTLIPHGGTTLSGGQRQRLLLARTLIKNPKILFLDEATSALDNQSQKVLQDYLEGVQATRIVIAHRLSTIINADKICVIRNGRIALTGTYSELKDEITRDIKI